jgi:hypothetical protein
MVLLGNAGQNPLLPFLTTPIKLSSIFNIHSTFIAVLIFTVEKEIYNLQKIP